MPGRKGRSGGRNALTVEEHRLRGTYDASRHAGKTHPTPRKGTPEPPVALRGSARREWRRMVADLNASGVLTVADGAMLYHYCELHAAALRTLRQIEAITRLPDDLDPALRLVRAEMLAKLETQAVRFRSAIRMYLVEFGVSPAARSRIELPHQPTQGDEMSEFDAPLKLVVPRG